MLAKHRKAALVTDFRPIASVRLFYQIFAYMILHRIEPCLDSHQPEEQHGFRAGRRLEEHLLTANLFLDKTLADPGGKHSGVDIEFGFVKSF